MRRCFLIVICVLAGGTAWAFGPATHAYIAMLATESTNHDILFGAMLPDCSKVLSSENPAGASALNHMTHFEYGLVTESCLGLGVSTHNGAWGADYYAHRVFVPGAEEIYSVVKIRQLSDEFGISLSAGEDLFEMALDYLIRADHGPDIGRMIARSAKASGEANAQAWVDAYAAELAARVAGMSLVEAQDAVLLTHEAFKQLVVVYGQQLQQAMEPLRATLMPLLAGYIGVDTETAGLYFARAIAICSDYQEEINRIVGNMRPLLYSWDCPDPEGEDEGEGEDEAQAVNFCEAFLRVAANPLLGQIGGQFMELIHLIDAPTADLNGDFSVDLTNMDAPLVTIHGNGLLDASNELALLAKILAAPGFDNGVLTHDIVHAAWEHNWAQLLNGNIGPAYGTMLVQLAPGLAEILTGYVCIGDGSLDTSGYFTASGHGSLGFVSGLLSVLNDALIGEFGSGLEQPQLNAEDFVRLGALWPDADADGDGFSNRDEYAYFAPSICLPGGKSSAVIGYVHAALNAHICPDCPDCPDCVATDQTFFRAGANACLRVPGVMTPETVFLWTKAGEEPLEDGRYVGVRCQSMSIPCLQPEDSGTYVCTYGSAKSVYIVTIQVAEQLPLAGFFGIAILASALAGAAAYRTRRLKR